MRKGYCVVLLASALLAGCGGGGSPPTTTGLEPEQVQGFSAGLVRGDVPTNVPLLVVKPFPEAGTVELAETPTGPFEPLAGTLPMTLLGGEKAVVRVTFSPPFAAADTHQQGTVRLLFRPATSDTEIPVTLHLDADIETPSARLTQTQLQLGNVPVGETVPCGITFENTSVVTPITVNSVNLAAGDFSLAPDAFAVPATVAPGSTFLVRLAYAPQGETGASSLLQVFHTAAFDPLEAMLGAKGIAPKVVVEYGAVPLDPVTHETDWLTLDVAPEGVGILLEAWGDPFAVLDLVGFEGPSGKVYETGSLAGPLDWLSGFPAGTKGFLNVEVPDSAKPEVQLEAGGGAYRFRLRHDSPPVSALIVRATVTQRRLVEVSQGTLDVRVFLASGLSLASRTKPMSDPKLNGALKTIDGILGASGIRLGTITFVFMEPPFDILGSEEETEALFAVNTAALPDGSLNLFLVRDITYGIGATAGSSPGPWTNGMPFCGVVAAYDAPQAIELGVTAAHEISHYLGWFGTSVLPDDAHAMLRHSLLKPGLPESLLSVPGTYEQAQVIANAISPSATWCGTCAHPAVR